MGSRDTFYDVAHPFLVRARERIEKKSRWCQGVNAMRISMHYGLEGCSLAAPCAIKWCALGSLARELWEVGRARDATRLKRYITTHPAYTLLQETSQKLYDKDLWDVNDTEGHTAVLRCYDHALAACAKQPTREYA